MRIVSCWHGYKRPNEVSEYHRMTHSISSCTHHIHVGLGPWFSDHHRFNKSSRLRGKIHSHPQLVAYFSSHYVFIQFWQLICYSQDFDGWVQTWSGSMSPNYPVTNKNAYFCVVQICLCQIPARKVKIRPKKKRTIRSSFLFNLITVHMNNK